jgi:hypothetical protein
MLGSVLFLVNKFNDMSRLFLGRPMPDVISGRDFGVILIGQISFIVGYVAYYRVNSERARGLGKNGLRVFCAGGIVLAVGHIGFMDLDAFLRLPPLPFDLFVFVLLGVALLLLGLIVFGIVNLRHPILGRWNWLPLATGLAGFVGFFLFGGEQITAVFLAFRTLFALGLLGLGLGLWLETRVRGPEPARESASLSA